MSRILRLLRSGALPTFWLLASLALVAGAGYAGWLIREAAMPGWLVQRVTVAPPTGDTAPVELSWRTLGRHGGGGDDDAPALSLRRSSDGGWFMTRPAATPDLSMLRPRRSRLDGLVLKTGQRLRAGTSVVIVREAGPDGLTVENEATGRRLELSADGEARITPTPVLASCRIDRLLAAWPDWLLWVDDWRRRQQVGGFEPIMSWGGGVDCPTRWAWPELAPGALGLFHDGDWRLAPLASGVALTVDDPDHSGQATPAFAERPVRLPPRGAETGAGSESALEIAVGRMSLGVRAEDDRLILEPRDGRQLLDFPPTSEDTRLDIDAPGIDWLGTPGERWLAEPETVPTLSRTAGAAAAAALILAAAAFPTFRADRRIGHWLRLAIGGAGLSALTATAVATTALAPFPPLVAWAALAGASWIWTTLLLASGGWLRGAGGPLWFLSGVMAAIGLATQTQLAVGGIDVARLALPCGAAKGLVVVALAIGVAVLPSPGRWRNALTVGLGAEGPPWRWLWVALAVCLLALLHGLWGRETGLAGLQPAEAFKAAWIVAGAAGASWFLHLLRIRAPGTRWLRAASAITGALGLILAAVIGALAAVDDFSPLIVLAVTFAVWLGLLTLRSTPLLRDPERPVSRWALLPSALLILLTLTAAGGLAYSGADGTGDAAEAIDGGAVYDRAVVNDVRIGSWLHPELFPNSGEQVRRAQDALAGLPPLPAPVRLFASRCEGEGARPAAIGRNCGEQTIPAVESDFVVAFWLAHTGRIGGGALLLVQWGVLLALAALCWEAGRGDRLADDFLHLATGGFAAALACQWIIGWGNPTGLLPVMGQPATLLSAGNSHLVLFALPCVFTGLLAAAIRAMDARSTFGR